MSLLDHVLEVTDEFAALTPPSPSYLGRSPHKWGDKVAVDLVSLSPSYVGSPHNWGDKVQVPSTKYQVLDLLKGGRPC